MVVGGEEEEEGGGANCRRGDEGLVGNLVRVYMCV